MLGILLASVVSLLVHMEYPVNRYILEKQCRNTTLFYIRVHSKAYHLAYMYLNAVLVVLATLILFVFAVLIYYELFGRTRSVQSGQEQRQSATRLTVATASTFLFLTAPQSPIFLYHFFNKTPSSVAVTIGAVVNFCGLLETTAPFFVYYACSKRFRQLCVLLLCRSCVALKAEDLQVLEGNRTRTSSVITTADFRDSTRCRADSQPLLPVNLKANPPPKYNNNDDNHTTKELDQSI